MLSHGLPRSSGRLAQISVSGFSLLSSLHFKSVPSRRNHKKPITHGQAHIAVGPSSVSQVHIPPSHPYLFGKRPMRGILRKFRCSARALAESASVVSSRKRSLKRRRATWRRRCSAGANSANGRSPRCRACTSGSRRQETCQRTCMALPCTTRGTCPSGGRCCSGCLVKVHAAVTVSLLTFFQVGT